MKLFEKHSEVQGHTGGQREQWCQGIALAARLLATAALSYYVLRLVNLTEIRQVPDFSALRQKPPSMRASGQVSLKVLEST